MYLQRFVFLHYLYLTVTFTVSFCFLNSLNAASQETIPLDEYLRRVLAHNESLQIQLLGVKSSEHLLKAEDGAFEPALVFNSDYTDTQRPNTVEQQRNLTGVPIFNQKSSLYSSGIESLSPLGTRVRLGYSLQRLDNNLQDGGLIFGGTTNGNEYVTFFGLSLVQPLLKGGGTTTGLASKRLAALTSEIAYQDYRKQLMTVLAAAEAAYLDLYMAQEQVRFLSESLELAESIVRDNQARSVAGTGSQLEILEAEAGRELRRSALADANQILQEARNRVISFFSTTVMDYPDPFWAEAPPEPNTTEALSRFDLWSQVFDDNPDYLSQRKRAVSEDVRLAYARRQRLPQLDLRSSYGLNGLGDSPARSWDDVERADFPVWSVGVELRIPLGGGKREKNELQAARLRKEQSLLALKELEVQLLNALDNAIHKVSSTRNNVDGRMTSVRLSQNLLDTEMERLNVGTSASRNLLQVEEDLFEAKNALVDSIVRYHKSKIELDLISGSVMRKRNLELTHQELRAQTNRWMEFQSEERDPLDGFLPKVQAQERAIEALRKEMQTDAERLP